MTRKLSNACAAAHLRRSSTSPVPFFVSMCTRIRSAALRMPILAALASLRSFPFFFARTLLALALAYSPPIRQNREDNRRFNFRQLALGCRKMKFSENIIIFNILQTQIEFKETHFRIWQISKMLKNNITTFFAETQENTYEIEHCDLHLISNETCAYISRTFTEFRGLQTHRILLTIRWYHTVIHKIRHFLNIAETFVKAFIWNS